MNKDFDEITNKILKAISEIEPNNNEQKKYKLTILYALTKMFMNEEVFCENLNILDTYSNYGLNSHIKKK